MDFIQNNAKKKLKVYFKRVFRSLKKFSTFVDTSKLRRFINNTGITLESGEKIEVLISCFA